MTVETIGAVNDVENTVTGELPASQKSLPGAFVPLNNNDWDYNRQTDLTQDPAGVSTAVPGDQYLLPVILNEIPGTTEGDYYQLTATPGINVWQNADRTGLIVSGKPGLFGAPPTPVQIPAYTSTTVYVEGASVTGPRPSFLRASLTWNGETLPDVDMVRINVFAIDGALDVPGNGIYTYSAKVNGGKWLAPFGGSLASGQQGTNGSVNITWINQALVGFANYQANTNYTWSCGVNVVRITRVPLGAVSDATYTGATAQASIGPLNLMNVESTPNLLQSAASFGGAVEMEGPTSVPGGVERGISYIQVGLIQNVQIAHSQSTFTDGAVRYDTGATGRTSTPWYVDYPPENTGPYYNPPSPLHDSPTHAIQVAVPGFGDRPTEIFTDRWLHWLSGISSCRVEIYFHVFIAAQTTYDDGHNSMDVCTPEAELNWQFNGSGYFWHFHTWQPIPTTGTSGDANFGAVSDDMKTKGPAANTVNAVWGWK